MSQPEIEVQVPKNKRKLNYLKLNQNQIIANRKSIQINTNLENQEEDLMSPDREAKDVKKQLNPSSISCGNITLNFKSGAKDKEKKNLRTLQSSVMKNQQKKLPQKTNTERAKKKKLVKRPIDNKYNSQLSNGSFYTPNSFY